jgi:hypothetical protein
LFDSSIKNSADAFIVHPSGDVNAPQLWDKHQVEAISTGTRLICEGIVLDQLRNYYKGLGVHDQVTSFQLKVAPPRLRSDSRVFFFFDARKKTSVENKTWLLCSFRSWKVFKIKFQNLV